MYELETEHETPHRPPVVRRELIPAVVIALISIASGIVLGFAIPWFPAQASTQAKQIDTLWYVLLVFGVVVFVAVETVVLYAVYKFRVKPGEESLDGPPIHGNTRLEIIWTAVPSAIIAGLVVYAAVVLQQIDKKPRGEVEVQVYAQQFAWSFGYANPVPGGKTIVSDNLYMIAGQPVDFRLHASDVLHGFWIPAFRVQEDAVPGVTTSLQATPTRVGTYDIICTELCGLGHSLMRSTVHVVTAAQYKTFLTKFVAAKTIPGATPPATTTAGATPPAAKAAGPTPPATTTARPTPPATKAAGATPPATKPAGTTPPATKAAGTTAPAAATTASVLAAGKTIFTGSAGCGSCHTLADAKTTGKVGPDLNKYLKGKSAAFVRTSIVNPDSFVEKGFGKGIMPGDFKTTLSADQINALVQYLGKVTAK